MPPEKLYGSIKRKLKGPPATEERANLEEKERRHYCLWRCWKTPIWWGTGNVQMLPGNGKLNKDILGRRSALSYYYCCIQLLPKETQAMCRSCLAGESSTRTSWYVGMHCSVIWSLLHWVVALTLTNTDNVKNLPSGGEFGLLIFAQPISPVSHQFCSKLLQPHRCNSGGAHTTTQCNNCHISERASIPRFLPARAEDWRLPKSLTSVL